LEAIIEEQRIFSTRLSFLALASGGH